MKIDFEVFDLPCDGNVLNIAVTMPGHPGIDFCGKGFKKSILTEGNYTRLMLDTGGSRAYGFMLRVKMLKGWLDIIIIFISTLIDNVTYNVMNVYGFRRKHSYLNTNIS